MSRVAWYLLDWLEAIVITLIVVAVMYGMTQLLDFQLTTWGVAIWLLLIINVNAVRRRPKGHHE